MSVEVHHGDALDVFRDVRGLASIVSDPPGGGSFMNLPFDVSHGGRDRWIPFWAERFKMAREATERGSYGLFWAFGRTAHWTACALDDAGWEIVRPILHLHGQGWSKAKSQLKPAQEVWWLCRWGGVTPLQIDRCRVRRSWAERSESWFRSGHSAKPDARKIAARRGRASTCTRAVVGLRTCCFRTSGVAGRWGVERCSPAAVGRFQSYAGRRATGATARITGRSDKSSRNTPPPMALR